MKKVTILFGALIVSISSYSQDWKVDKAHSKLGFSISHLMVSDVDGMFTDFDATIASSKPDFSDAVFTLTAKTTSINTGNEKRDTHLKSADFFDAEKNPVITFKSNSINKTGENKYKLSGDLTMHGVTKLITLDLTLKGPTVHPMSKKPLAGFKATGTIKRSDFKIAEGTPSAMVGDEVEIIANGEFVKG